MKRIMSFVLVVAVTAALFTGCGCAANVSDHPGGMITEEPTIMPRPTATHATEPSSTTLPRPTQPTTEATQPTTESTQPTMTEGTTAPTETGAARNRNTAR